MHFGEVEVGERRDLPVTGSLVDCPSCWGTNVDDGTTKKEVGCERIDKHMPIDTLRLTVYFEFDRSLSGSEVLPGWRLQ